MSSYRVKSKETPKKNVIDNILKRLWQVSDPFLQNGACSRETIDRFFFSSSWNVFGVIGRFLLLAAEHDSFEHFFFILNSTNALVQHFFSWERY